MKKLLLTLLLTITANAESCWTSLELSKFAQDELDDKVTFTIRDAVSCEAVSNAELYLGNMKFQADSSGLVKLPSPPENMDMELPVTIKSKGYITAKESVPVSFGSYWKKQFLMSKKLPLESARFVLSWGERPSDLDLHLIAKTYHISYRNTKNIPLRVRLDKDTTNGFGAETITVDTLDEEDEYKVLIYNFSNKSSIDKKVQLKVYANNKLDNTVTLSDSNQRCLEIASIKNNVITYDTKASSLCVSSQ